MPTILSLPAWLQTLPHKAASIGLIGRRPLLWALGFALFGVACWNVVLGTITAATPLLIAAITALVGGFAAWTHTRRRDGLLPFKALDALFTAACGVLGACAPVLAFTAATPHPFPSLGFEAAQVLPHVGDILQAHQAARDAIGGLVQHTLPAPSAAPMFLSLLGQAAVGFVCTVVWMGMGLGKPRPAPHWWRAHAARAAWSLLGQGVAVEAVYLRLGSSSDNHFSPMERPFHFSFADGFHAWPCLDVLHRAAHPSLLPLRLPLDPHAPSSPTVLAQPVWTLPRSAHGRLAEMARYGHTPATIPPAPASV